MSQRKNVNYFYTTFFPWFFSVISLRCRSEISLRIVRKKRIKTCIFMNLPFWTDTWSAEYPNLDFSFIFAPFLNKTSTIPFWPKLQKTKFELKLIFSTFYNFNSCLPADAAAITGVQPSSFLMLTSNPLRINSLILFTFPEVY